MDRIRMSARTSWSNCRLPVAAAVLLAATAATLAQGGFPFEQEMLLDARPLPGSRRIPILEIAADGRAQIDLWCRSGPGLVEIAGSAIKFTLGPLREQACTPDRAQRDEEMAAALSQVTRWRREGEFVVFVGPAELRFHLSSH
jgi:hypothetical protein